MFGQRFYFAHVMVPATPRLTDFSQGAIHPNPPGRMGLACAWLKAGCAGVVWAVLSAALVACQPLPSPPLKVGMKGRVGYDPLVLAVENQQLDRRQVKLIELSSSSETLRNFRNGLLDGAALTLDEALRLADEGIGVKIVAVLDASAGADVVMANDSVQALEQLKGKSIAVERTTVGVLILRRLLLAAELTEGDVVVRYMEASQHLDALRSRRVDAAVTYEPLAERMVLAGYHPVFDSRQMPGEILNVLVVREDVLAQRPGQVDALLVGWQAGLKSLTDDPEGSAALLSQGLSLTPQAYRASLSGLHFHSAQESMDLLSGQPKRLGQAAERLVLTLMDLQQLRDTPDWGRLLEEAPAARALQRNGRLP